MPVDRIRYRCDLLRELTQPPRLCFLASTAFDTTPGLFPEGTTSPGFDVLPFYANLFEPARRVCIECRKEQRRERAAARDATDFDIDVVAPPPNQALIDLMARQAASEQARAKRLASDTAPLKPGDTSDETYSAERRREYDEKMGQFANELKDLTATPTSTAQYLSDLAEQERRWLGRRLGRSLALGAARETLMARQFEVMASRIQWPAAPLGYAKATHTDPVRRAVTLFLSDLHVGAIQPADEVPEGHAFDFVKAGRRLAHIAIQCAEFKTSYRDVTTLNLCFAGDIIEGLLGHQPESDNAPLTEQMVAVSHMLFSITRYLSSAFPSVAVHCVPGNHGRNKLTHPGRATSSKWNSFETVCYAFVRAQCASLGNVTFNIPKAPAIVLQLFDKAALITHGDTELALKAPSASGGKNSWGQALSKMNSQGTYGQRIDLLAAGHFHDPAVFYFADGVAVANGWGHG